MKKEIIEQVRSAILDMMSKVELDKYHNYTIKETGKWVAGVSSISSILPKPFLVPWASKMAVSYLGYEDKKLAQKMIKKIGKMSVKQYQALLHRAKGAFNKVSDRAKLDGTKGHEFLEMIVKSRIRKQPLPKTDYGDFKRPIKQFLKWEKENIKTWILSEAIVSDTELEFSGTLDGLAITKGDKLAVIDFKFANQISKSYHIQTAGYALPFEKYGIKIEDRIIIRLPKTLTKLVYNKRLYKYDEVENNIEIGRSPFPYELDKETFLNARILYKYINAVKKEWKQRSSIDKKEIKT